MTNKVNLGTILNNLYAVGPPDVQPVDFTKLGDHPSVQHLPQKQITEILYTSNQIVCIKGDNVAYEKMLKLTPPFMAFMALIAFWLVMVLFTLPSILTDRI